MSQHDELLRRLPQGPMPLGPWLVQRTDGGIAILGDGGTLGAVTLAVVPFGVMSGEVAARVAAVMADAPELRAALRTVVVDAHAELATARAEAERARAALSDLIAFEEWERTTGGVTPSALIGVWDRARAAISQQGPTNDQ